MIYKNRIGIRITNVFNDYGNCIYLGYGYKVRWIRGNLFGICMLINRKLR
jgi:hypothetical protein